MTFTAVATGIATLVGAFATGWNLFKDLREDRRKKKKTRAQEYEEQVVENSLAVGGSHIQQEYNRHVAILGQRFARGDGKSDLRRCSFPLKRRP